MAPILVNFSLTPEQAETVMEVLTGLNQTTNNPKIRSVTRFLLRNVKQDVWAKSHATALLITLLSKKTSQVGIHENSSLRSYLRLTTDAIKFEVPKWCSSVLLKVCKDGNLGRPKDLVTTKKIITAKPTKVKDLVKLILNEVP